MNNKYIFLYEKTKLITKIVFDDIFYIQSCGDYVEFYFKDRRLVILGTMQELLNILPKESFYRCHRSYIVNMDKVSSIQDETIHLLGIHIPIGESYKQVFYKEIGYVSISINHRKYIPKANR